MMFMTYTFHVLFVLFIFYFSILGTFKDLVILSLINKAFINHSDVLIFQTPSDIVTLDGQKLKEVADFQYLDHKLRNV